MVPAGKYISIRGSKYLVIGSVFLGGGTNDPVVWIFLWDVSEAMMREVEGTNVGFLRQIRGKRLQRTIDGS